MYCVYIFVFLRQSEEQHVGNKMRGAVPVNFDHLNKFEAGFPALCHGKIRSISLGTLSGHLFGEPKTLTKQ